MARKEVYASTGTRMVVRVFAGWGFEANDVPRPDFAEHGYRNGVPMGADLTGALDGKSPKFLVRALRDPDGANLDRMQIVKGWLDSRGKSHERVYDVAVSGGRTIGAEGRCEVPVGDTVDIANASYTNTIGSAYLAAFWEDPEFDRAQNAFYYVRVLEIPTQLDSLRFKTFRSGASGRSAPEGAGTSEYQPDLVFSKLVRLSVCCLARSGDGVNH